MSARGVASAVLSFTLALSFPVRAELVAPPPGVDAKTVAQRADDMLRSDRTTLVARMIVTSPRLSRPRTVAFRSWEDRPGRRSFVRILEPAKDAGSGFLMLHPNLWMYIPRVERTLRIPPSMMLQSWMGSDFSNDDLVKSSSAIDDYEHSLLGVDVSPEFAPGRRAYVVEYRPREGAPVVWGRIVAWIDVEHATPLRQEFYDEAGEKLRILTFEDVREVEGRFVPHRWILLPVEKPGHRSVIEIESIDFDAEIGDSIFTTRHLMRTH